MVRLTPPQEWLEVVLDPQCWRDAVVAWLGQRVALAVIFKVSAWLFGMNGVGRGASLGLAVASSPWLNWWDSGHYIDIARSGYTAPSQSVFYPLYPLAERAGASVLSGDYVLAGFVASNIACLGAMISFRLLAAHALNPHAARVALVCFALAPMAVYLAITYSESLYLLFAISALLAIRRRWWLAAGFASALAVLTRQAGMLLLVPFAIEGLEQLSRDRRARNVLGVTAGLVMPLLAFVAFGGYLAHHFGPPLVVLTAERDYWQRYLDWPWVGPLQATNVMLTAADGGARWNAAYDLGVTVFMGVASLVTAFWARLPLAYGAYVLIGFVGLVMLPVHGSSIGEDLNGLPRYLLTIFPVFLGLAMWSDARPVRTALAIGSCAAGFVIRVAYFGHPPLVL